MKVNQFLGVLAMILLAIVVWANLKPIALWLGAAIGVGSILLTLLFVVSIVAVLGRDLLRYFRHRFLHRELPVDPAMYDDHGGPVLP